MSGGKKKASRGQGWEEAGAEFYQESYPVDSDFDLMQTDPSRLATLLPSKHARTGATIRIRTNGNRMNGRTMRKDTYTRSRRESTVQRRPSAGGEVQLSMLPDLSQPISTEETVWNEIMLIKEMPVSMAEKRRQKQKIMHEPNFRLQGYEEFKWKKKKAWKQFRPKFIEAISKLELWRSSLKHIEGNFGTGVVAYFLFLRWLFFLNASVFILIFLFITLPVILDQPNNLGKCNSSMNSSCCSEEYFNQSPPFKPLDLIQGTGIMERTVLFYGIYPETVLESLSHAPYFFYNFPLTYLIVVLVCFIIALVLIVKAAARGFRERLVEGEGQFYQYCNLVFGGWDYCIHNEKSARMKHKAIYREIKMTIESDKREEERQNRTRNEKYKIFIIRIFVNILVLGILGAAAFGIYKAFDMSINWLTKAEKAESIEKQLEMFFFEFLPSMVIVCLNMVVPLLFNILIRFERYGPQFLIRMTLFRTIFLRLASLIVLYASLLHKITCKKEDKNECGYCDSIQCWETFVGQQIYKLMITDFATHVVMTFLVNFPRAMLAKHCNQKFFKVIGEQTFDLPKNVLDIVYSQTLCWFGLFYAPLISCLASFIFFLMFYVKKFTCLVNSSPCAVVYRASRSHSMFMLFLLLAYVFALLPIAYSVSELVPSNSCGPFRGLPSVWSLVVESFMKTPDWLRDVVFFISTAGFAIPVFIILLLLIYYYSAVNSANRHMVSVLKNQLVLEGHDKQFLLERLSMFMKQENRKKQRHQAKETDRNVYYFNFSGFENLKKKKENSWKLVKPWESLLKLELWKGSLKHIEGNLGTGIASYFLFLRWIFLLNALLFFIVLGFITIPVAIVKLSNKGECGLDSTLMECCSKQYFNQNPPFKFLDLLQGTGKMERTLLFYGYYPYEIFGSDQDSYYDMPLGYLTSILASFLTVLVLVVVASARGFQERILEGNGKFFQYCNLIFGGWDYCIANEKSARMKHKALYREMKICIESDKIKEEKQKRTNKERNLIITIRLVINLLVLGILGGAGFAIYKAFDISTNWLSKAGKADSIEKQLEMFFYEFLPSLVMVCLNMIVPVLFNILIRFEKYEPQFIIRMTLFRTIFLRLASLAVLYASLLNKVTCSDEDKNECGSCNSIQCWETFVGQQIYKLMITDFATNVVVTFLVNFPRAMLAKHCNSKLFKIIGEQSFDLPKNVLDIVYSQTLCWFGLFYAPLISCLASVYFFLIFYIKKFTCLINSSHNGEVYRASRSHSMFMLFLLLAYLFALLPVAYSVSELVPSMSCGPFRGLSSVWTLVVESFMKTPGWLQDTVFFIDSAGFAIPVFMILVFLVFYYSAKNSANKEMVSVLKDQLVLEGHDKQFLLERLNLLLRKRAKHTLN